MPGTHIEMEGEKRFYKKWSSHTCYSTHTHASHTKSSYNKLKKQHKTHDPQSCHIPRGQQPHLVGCAILDSTTETSSSLADPTVNGAAVNILDEAFGFFHSSVSTFCCRLVCDFSPLHPILFAVFPDHSVPFHHSGTWGVLFCFWKDPWLKAFFGTKYWTCG